MSVINSHGLALISKCGLTYEKFSEITRQNQCMESLTLGVIQAESNGNWGALRLEPGYPYLHTPAEWAKSFSWTVETEKALQSFSYGLMQIMLATARELGFSKHPSFLLDPAINLAWGTLHFGRLAQRYQDWADAVSAYNQGNPAKKTFSKAYKNQAYVDRVYSYAASFESSSGTKIS